MRRNDDRSPAERRLGAQIAANTRWSQVTNRTTETAPMRDGFEERFRRLAREQAEQRGEKPTAAEIASVAETLRKLHYQQMSLKAAQARRRKKR